MADMPRFPITLFNYRRRVITLLRRHYPGKWWYVHKDHTWKHEGGWRVYVRVAMSWSGWESDDYSPYRHYYRSDTHEQIYI
jgi:hypothetical protein